MDRSNQTKIILHLMGSFIFAFLAHRFFGYLMHKTDTLWGSTLYHAGSDVFLFYLMDF
jgi:membrane protease YdiL (CAAX protease family)